MIDYSNGYPVQITSNVNANTPWKEVFAMNPTKSNFTDWDFHFKDNPAWKEMKLFDENRETASIKEIMKYIIISSIVFFDAIALF